MDKDFWTEKLIVPLYEEGYLQTIWNARNEKNHRQGWELKGGKWSPYYFNMRHVGGSPELFRSICYAILLLANDHKKNVDTLIGVEMAGINVTGGVAVMSVEMPWSKKFRIGYTRPLPIKSRTPEHAAIILEWIGNGSLNNKKMADEAIDLLASFKKNLHVMCSLPVEESQKLNFALNRIRSLRLTGDLDYGQKSYVEASLLSGDRVAIVDDMSTDLGSKIISRMIVLWQAERMGIEISCNTILYLLNRDRSNIKKGLEFSNSTDSRMYPEKLNVDYVIEFDEALKFLKRVMKDEEYELISTYQRYPGQFQDKGTQKEALALAARY